MKKSSRKNFALLSVFDKTGIVELATSLKKAGFEILTTGGTAKKLTGAGVGVTHVEKITGNPESFDGRMKTISFRIESGILFDRKNQKHLQEASELNVPHIDIVVCNLYPFEQTIAKKTVSVSDAVENIDVGGPTMIRAAAKNFKNVVVLVDPADYAWVAEKTQKNSLSEYERQQLAAKAFYHLSFYDSQIAHHFSDQLFPEELTLPGRRAISLRYGENAHQQAALYLTPNTATPFASLKKQWGRDLSLTNLTDINAGLEVVRLFTSPAAVVIKHNNPCGIALGENAKEALQRAIDADPESAFGGVIVLNKPMDLRTAKIIASFKEETKGNMDIVAVPEIGKDALGLLSKTRKSMGIYTFGEIPETPKGRMDTKWIDGGFILQTRDDEVEAGFKDWKVVTKKKPSAKQREQMQTAWKFITRIKSNAVIVVDKKLPMTRGIGTGQTSRVRAVKIALSQAGKFADEAVLASDSFFPFDDSVKLATEHGIKTIVQQGGSINDKASIEAADRAGICMVFTNRRAFWH
ncbi:MAG: bifunctional phosphoribosylaminoimidazolecarboxamide formyltransferase/IMP cyclohydrolase [bacterium]|nr:bifunctional phosphoribosylaminoimidazolecarboxamide formyltransferase/IMP cyclohydrolase [bacterium]